MRIVQASKKEMHGQVCTSSLFPRGENSRIQGGTEGVWGQ
ncbi:hypothetical protein MTR67_053711 [Solanum verrucosum]|uniref:Uncharacterized protein n=1 Tax=Solanum verrucosum TaxID=315347 RepID=A0AAF0VB67_SOLVR|nr:hypothetical protein MTR67_053711 [Solanum verrucosum]